MLMQERCALTEHNAVGGVAYQTVRREPERRLAGWQCTSEVPRVNWGRWERLDLFINQQGTTALFTPARSKG